MEQNLSDAILMAFGMIVFIIGLSVTMFIFNKLIETTEKVYNSKLTTQKVNTVEYNELLLDIRERWKYRNVRKNKETWKKKSF